MDFFKFVDTIGDPSFLQEGEMINGIRTARWVERYRDAGEFELTAPVSSGLRDFLPIGTIISHIDTPEAMIVETHEIDEDVEDHEPEIIISGSSLETWLKQRSVGANTEADGGLIVFLSDYTLPYDVTWEQAERLISRHIVEGGGGTPLINTGDEALGFQPIAMQQHIGTSNPATRIVRRGNLYDRVIELLEIDDFGIKVVRPNLVDGNPPFTQFRIHNGFDRRDSVIFSHVAGDLKKTKYLWSDKNLKTDAYIVSTFNEVRVNSAAQGYNRRILYVDASDLDSQETDWPTGPDRAQIIANMYIRGIDAILRRRSDAILRTDVSLTTRYKFRQHYDVGDLVTVNGNYNTSSIMRVAEHVEFQDENGESGYPTLTIYE